MKKISSNIAMENGPCGSMFFRIKELSIAGWAWGSWHSLVLIQTNQPIMVIQPIKFNSLLNPFKTY